MQFGFSESQFGPCFRLFEFEKVSVRLLWLLLLLQLLVPLLLVPLLLLLALAKPKDPIPQ